MINKNLIIFLIVFLILLSFGSLISDSASKTTGQEITLKSSFFSYASGLRGGYFVAAGNLFGDAAEEIVTGTGEGFSPHVRVFNQEGVLKTQFFAFESSLRNGVAVATCDLEGTEVENIVTAQGRGGRPQVKIFNGYGQLVNSFSVLDGQFLGGVSVACGDINGDNLDEIIVAALQGGGPQVMVYTSAGKVMANFFAYHINFRGGVNVTALDIDIDECDEIVTVPQYGAPHVRIFNINPGSIESISSGFYAFDSTSRGGASVSAADTNGDGIKEILVSSGSGLAPSVRGYTATGELLYYFSVYRSTFTGGVRVTGGDIDGDTVDEILVIPRSLGGPHVQIYDVDTEPLNIILFVGDGMGFEQVKAGSYFQSGVQGALSFEQFLFQSQATTRSADSAVTDSAAAATAMATGVKVNNGVISVRLPGDGSNLPTVLESYKALGKSTGLITTASIVDATPAAFGAHAVSRNLAAEISGDFLNDSKPNILFGGGSSSLTSAGAVSAGYEVVATREALLDLNPESYSNISGQFASGNMNYEYDGIGTQPHLSEMTEVALNILDNNVNGFFLLVEGGRIDHAAHSNSINRLVYEVKEFSEAVSKAISWAGQRRDTLILVAADHETGGLKVLSGNKAGSIPTVSWETASHTSANIPVYASGCGASKLSEPVIDNTDIFTLLGG